jgi:hypothetical protein
MYDLPREFMGEHINVAGKGVEKFYSTPFAIKTGKYVAYRG